MKTKYILHGGSAQHPNEENDEFFSAILEGAPTKVNILLVHFAASEDYLKTNFDRDSSQFLRVKDDRQINFVVAEKTTFLDQIKSADVIYFGGGTTTALIDALSEYPTLKDTLEGKIVAGESAGANVFCSYCYSKSGGGVIKGLGIIPIFLYPHYNPEISTNLEEVPSDAEKIFLQNYQFKVFEV